MKKIFIFLFILLILSKNSFASDNCSGAKVFKPVLIHFAKCSNAQEEVKICDQECHCYLENRCIR